MLEIHDLTVAYGANRVLSDFNLTVKPACIYAVAGESGTGKTTLALTIMGLLKNRSQGVEISGTVMLNGMDLLTLNETQQQQWQWNRVSMVFQHPESAFNPVYSISRQIIEPLQKKKQQSLKQAQIRCREVLDWVGLPESCFNAYPHQLSLGERQLALFAMAAAGDPDLLILDEPTSALDNLSRQRIAGLMAELGQKKMILLITHDLGLIHSLAADLTVLYGGRPVESGRAAAVLDDPFHPYSRALIRCFPDMKRTRDLQGMRGQVLRHSRGCAFSPRCTQAKPICSNVLPPVVERDDRRIHCHLGGVIPLLEIEGLCKKYQAAPILKSIDLTVYEGETLSLIGPSGAGKSTLAKCIVGLEKPEQGRMKFKGDLLALFKIPVDHVQLIYQNPRESISHRMNILDAVSEPLVIQKIGSAQTRLARVKQVLAEVQLPNSDDFLAEYPHHLSGGEVQRVAIARALILNPQLLIADEPTSALDASVQAKIIRLLFQLQQDRGLGILFITHDLALARKISDRIAVLNQGEIMEIGSAVSVLTAAKHPFTRQFIGLAGSYPILSDAMPTKNDWKIINTSQSID